MAPTTVCEMSKTRLLTYVAIVVLCPAILQGQEEGEAGVPTEVAIEAAQHGLGGEGGESASDAPALRVDKPLAKKPRRGVSRQRNYPPQMKGATKEVYKTIGDTTLSLYAFRPNDHSGNESRPAIVFFFGGGWRGGTPQQFEQHCRYLASRGMIAMTADYRVASRNQTKADACVKDGKSAIRWIRKNARRLGVDPDRIVAGGGSAGGHVAACTATIQEFEESGEGETVSSRPNALALFNPAVVLSTIPLQYQIDSQKLKTLRQRMGVDPVELSPFHQLKKGLPPTILFHGKADSTVPFRTAELFVAKATTNGDDVTLVSYEGQTHGFFNFGRNENEFYIATMKKLDSFLVDRGLLEGPTPANIEIMDKTTNR